MPLAVAKAAHFCSAPTTLSKFSAIFLVDISRFDPFSTSSSWTVNTILGREFLKFPIPVFLEIRVEKSFDMLKRYMIGSATFWRHVLRIVDRKPENSS